MTAEIAEVEGAEASSLELMLEEAPVPRHQDVKNSLVALICRQLGVRRP